MLDYLIACLNALPMKFIPVLMLFVWSIASHTLFIAELTERSPIIIQNSSNLSSRKNLDVQPYDRPYKVLLLAYLANCATGTIL